MKKFEYCVLYRRDRLYWKLQTSKDVTLAEGLERITDIDVTVDAEFEGDYFFNGNYSIVTILSWLGADGWELINTVGIADQLNPEIKWPAAQWTFKREVV